MSEDNIKKIQLSFSGETREISYPKNFSQLKESFFNIYQVDKNKNSVFAFFYKNEKGDFTEIKETEDDFKNFETKLNELENRIIYVKNKEEEKIENNQTNNEDQMDIKNKNENQNEENNKNNSDEFESNLQLKESDELKTEGNEGTFVNKINNLANLIND